MHGDFARAGARQLAARRDDGADLSSRKGQRRPGAWCRSTARERRSRVPSCHRRGGTSGMSVIHDLGYKRYIGTRRSAATRWMVVMRHQIAMGWKKWWRYKLALGFAFITLAVASGLLFFATGETMRSFGSRGGTDIAMTFADGVVPLSISHFCRAAFILSLTLGASIIASDTQSGAFTFYYVRSIRPRDYVLGKLAGYGLLVATIVIIGPLILAGMRLGFSASTHELLEHLDI